MSNDKQVMSHDPLAGIEDGELEEAQQGSTAPEPLAEGELEADILLLPSSLTIADVTEYQAQLLRSLEQGGPSQIDGREIDAIDGAGLQLLCAFVKELSDKSLPVSWVGASEVLIDSAGRMGVVQTLQIDAEQQAA